MEARYTLEPRPELRWSFSPRMDQSLHFLQCSATELVAHVMESLAENVTVLVDPPPLMVAHAATGPRGLRGRYEGAYTPPWDSLRAEPSMADVLLSQVRMACRREDVVVAAEQVIGCLDERGYLVETVAGIAALATVSTDVAEEAIALVQRCDPPGIGATSLEQCLLIQAEFLPTDIRSVVERIVRRHLQHVADDEQERIAAELDEPLWRIENAIQCLRQLNPTPGSLFHSTSAVTVVPDVLVEERDEGLYVRLNEEMFPTIRFLENPVTNSFAQAADAHQFWRLHHRQARMVQRAVDSRQQTILRVASEVVRVQREYLLGESPLAPLTGKELAKRLSLHASTVCRALQNKWMLTPRGVLPFQALLSRDVQQSSHSSMQRQSWPVLQQSSTRDDEDSAKVSAHALRERLREMFAEESKTRPLSDAALCRELARMGIVVARRTVAKYREEMGVGSSWERAVQTTSGASHNRRP
jgi:RNA polymerase sigma-54 factor